MAVQIGRQIRALSRELFCQLMVALGLLPMVAPACSAPDVPVSDGCKMERTGVLSGHVRSEPRLPANVPHVQPTSRAVCSSASAMQTRVLGGCGSTLAGSMELLDARASNHDPPWHMCCACTCIMQPINHADARKPPRPPRGGNQSVPVTAKFSQPHEKSQLTRARGYRGP